ncbi:hypothetical protein K0T92_06940 [Paenibacillus oenotherae]|uniref:Uncharacterized protein n=1 Tax=Paenibacillus oenotherae TaxID=1435645 RepID=A0ABS7D4H8_9BACL|nr:hypothetical protein [Paenibacillus oenotherae]MBW7474477.1 hypothetical protein [Paenibacillus oenotherae]
MSEINDFKRLTIHKLDHLLTELNAVYDERYTVVVLTNFGYVRGRYHDIMNTKASELAKSVKLTEIDNPPAILLKDVEIRAFANGAFYSIHEEMVLFTDQIVGIKISDHKGNIF